MDQRDKAKTQQLRSRNSAAMEHKCCRDAADMIAYVEEDSLGSPNTWLLISLTLKGAVFSFRSLFWRRTSAEMEQTVIRDGAEMPQRCSTGAAQVQHTWRRNSAERTERWSRNGAETVGEEVETVGRSRDTAHDDCKICS